jgi:hypothetical protein
MILVNRTGYFKFPTISQPIASSNPAKGTETTRLGSVKKLTSHHKLRGESRAKAEKESIETCGME